VAAVIFILGVGGGTVWIAAAIALSGRGGTPFLAPGVLELRIEKAGKYQIWNEADAVFQGRRYKAGAFLPADLRFQIANLQTGQEVPLLTPALTLRVEGGAVFRCAVGSFKVPEPGRYAVRAAGLFPPRVFSVQRARADLLIAFSGGGLLCVSGGLAGPVMAFLVFARRGVARRKLYGADY
jgi:hypothetical protein